jgi:ectoine hydroxylase-related dioxygenase (phytanoyl-CoA dioxygenase family)
MQFVAGSHANQILPHEDTFADNNLLSRGQEIQVQVAEEDKTDIVLRPGQVSLHHGRMIHGSGPNSSEDRRIGFVIRYVSPDVMQEVAQKTMRCWSGGRIGRVISCITRRRHLFLRRPILHSMKKCGKHRGKL